jgi:hypothetical protein
MGENSVNDAPPGARPSFAVTWDQSLALAMRPTRACQEAVGHSGAGQPARPVALLWLRGPGPRSTIRRLRWPAWSHGGRRSTRTASDAASKASRPIGPRPTADRDDRVRGSGAGGARAHDRQITRGTAGAHVAGGRQWPKAGQPRRRRRWPAWLAASGGCCGVLSGSASAGQPLDLPHVCCKVGSLYKLSFA